MRIILLSSLMILAPMLAFGDLRWYKFGDPDGKRQIFKFGSATVSIQAENISDAPYPGDDLVLILQMPGQKARQYNFNSAYGYGSVTVYRNLLLLKYGVGRGTFVREDHVKILQLDYYMTESADITSSSWVLTDPHNAAPDLFEYQLKVQTAGGYTTFIFTLPKPQRGIPSEKIVRLKNDE